MKNAFVLLFCCALISQVQAQTYRARNAAHTREALVPAKVVKKFRRSYPDFQVDSCSFGGYEAVDEELFVFYGKQQNRVVSATFERRGKPILFTVEITVQELPQKLQKEVTDMKQEGFDVVRTVKSVSFIYGRSVAYIIEWFDGNKGYKRPRLYDEDGTPSPSHW